MIGTIFGRQASSYSFLGSLTILVVLAFLSNGAAAQSVIGGVLFEKTCAQCHRNPAEGTHAPNLVTLKEFPPERILAALTAGPMTSIAQANGYNETQLTAIAEFASGRPLGSVGQGNAASMPNKCIVRNVIDPSVGGKWNGWSPDAGNQRFQNAEMAKLSPDDVSSLKVAWTFGAPGATTMYAQPTVFGGRLFTSSDAGFVYSIDAKTGCVYWSFEAKAGVRTAILILPVNGIPGVRYAAYFGDVRSNAYAINAETGEELWRVRVEEHPLSRITGGIVQHDGVLFVPVSSWEETAGKNLSYECCTFRGSLVALDAVTGKTKWQSYTIPNAPSPVRKNSMGTQLWGAAGAAIWSAPTIDPKRGVIYVTTGNAYTAPAAETSDAVLAFDISTGELLWSHQIVANDAWLVGCAPEDKDRTENCPPKELQNLSYNDVDIGASAILTKLKNGKEALIVAGESGGVYALDPKHKGRVIWRTHLGEAPRSEWQPGIGFGAAVGSDRVYLALERYIGGLTALDLNSGERIWHTKGAVANCEHAAPGCNGMQQSAVTLIPKVIFSGAGDGMLRAYSTETGEVLWEFNTARPFETDNAVNAKGGSVRGPGVTVVDGFVYVGSGYGAVSGMPGNVLIAFTTTDHKGVDPNKGTDEE